MKKITIVITVELEDGDKVQEDAIDYQFKMSQEELIKKLKEYKML